MIMTQNRSSYDWQICIGTCHIMRKLLNKIKEFIKSYLINRHRNMILIKYNLHEY